MSKRLVFLQKTLLNSNKLARVLRPRLLSRLYYQNTFRVFADKKNGTAFCSADSNKLKIKFVKLRQNVLPGLLRSAICDALSIVIDRFPYRLFGKNRTMDFLRRKTVKFFNNFFICESESLFDRLADDHTRRSRT